MILIWGLLLALVLAYIYYRSTIRPYLIIETMFPGPYTYPIVGNALMMISNSDVLYEKFHDLCYLFRRSFRVWIGNKPFVVIINPEDCETVLSSTVHLTKSENYQFLLPWIGDGLLTTTGEKWRKHRKILTPAFHFKILEQFVEVFNRNGDIFCEILSKIPEDQTFDLYEYVKMYALDNICETAMGVCMNAQKNPNSAYVKAVKDMCAVAFRRMIKAWLRIEIIFKLSKYSKMQKEALEIIHGTTYEVIRKRKSQMKENPNLKFFSEGDEELNVKGKLAFLDILLQSADEYGLTDDDIREEVDTFMFEGHDTVTSGISFALYLLANHPEAQEKVFQEVQSIFEGEKRPATLRDLQSMKYLEQTIKESLRLYPSVPLIGRVAEEDLILDYKAYVPKGAQVLLAIGAFHRHYHFWEKPHEFYPEHFSPEQVRKRHPFAFVPFSAGPRNCIGQRFAMLEMKSALSKVIQEFELLPSSNPEHEIKQFPELVLTSVSGYHIRLRKRKN